MDELKDDDDDDDTVDCKMSKSNEINDVLVGSAFI